MIRSTAKLMGAIFYFSSLSLIVAARLTITNGLVNEEEGKKSQGFQVQTVETEVLDLLDDFDRYSKRKDWAKAFQVAEKLFDKTSGGMIQDESGFYVPFYDRLWNRLADLPEDGRRAYRLFGDAKAEKLFSEIAPATEAKTLLKLYRQYFVTEIGDNAADQLAELSFEQGEYGRAERIWNQILNHCPNSDLDRARINMKRGTALARSGEEEGLADMRKKLGTSLDRQPLRVGGEEVKLSDYLESLELSPVDRASSARVELVPDLLLPETLEPEWQFGIIDEMTTDILKRYSRNYYTNVDSMMIPPVTWDEKKLYVNWFGNIVAIERDSGKLLWRSTKNHDMIKKSSSNFFRQLGLGLHSVFHHVDKTTGKAQIIAVGYQDPKNSNSRFVLASLDPETGKIQWTTEKKDDLKSWSFVGRPIIVGDKLFAVGNSNNEYELFSLRLPDGKLEWRLPLGSLEYNSNYYGYVQLRPKPSLSFYQGHVFVLSHYGALLAVDTASRKMVWACKYDPPSIPQNQYYSSWSKPKSNALFSYSAPLRVGSQLYVKESFGNRLYALDLDERKLSWARPVNQSDKVLLIDDEHLLVLGKELSAINMEDRQMKWSTQLAARSGKMNGLVTKDRIYVLSPRGIFEINREDGDIEKLYRTADPYSLGGQLFKLDDLLITVSNRSVTAYKLQDSN